MNKKVKELLDRVVKKKDILDTKRPLPKELINNLFEWFKVEQTYSSNAIEGNTFTKSETAIVVEKGLTISGKSLKEHLEIKNYSYAIDFIQKIAQKSKKDIDIKLIKQIHFLILKGVDDSNAGIFRKVEVKILGSDLKLPDPIKIQDIMENFIAWLHKTKKQGVIIAFDAHYKFVKVHPFVDGNGRVARLLLNLLLIQFGYPPVIVDPSDRLLYIDSMQEIDTTGEKEVYYLFMLKCLENSLDIYLDVESKTI